MRLCTYHYHHDLLWNCRIDVSGGRTLRHMFGGVVRLQVLFVKQKKNSYALVVISPQ